MNTIIRIYSKSACAEFKLPLVSEERHSFRIEKEVFQLAEDVEVRMMALDGCWCFEENNRYRITNQQMKEIWFLRKVDKEMHFLLQTNAGENLVLEIDVEPNKMPISKKYLMEKKKIITIGHALDNDIRLKKFGMISGHHAELEYIRDGWLLRNVGQNGTYLNGQRLEKWKMLEYGDAMEFFGVRIIYLGDMIAILDPGQRVTGCSPNLKRADEESLKWMSMISAYGSEKKGETQFRPAPRILADFDTDEFEIEAPPTPKKQKEKSLFLTLGPSITMVLPMLLGMVLMGNGSLGFGLVTMVGSAVIGAFWALTNQNAQKKNDMLEEEERSKKYKEYLVRKEKELIEQYEFNKKELEKAYPATKDCLAYDGKSAGLWNRNKNQPDFLTVRVGTGEVDLPKEIRIPQERFTLVDDSLAKEPQRIKSTYEKMKDAPICVDFMKNQVIGVIGGDDYEGIYPVFRTVITQIAANWNYVDLKLVLIADKNKEQDRALLDEVKWLPHMWNDDRTLRYAGDDRASVSEVFSAILTEFKQRKELEKDEIPTPWYVVLVTAPHLIDEVAASSFLYDTSHPMGTTTLVGARKFEELPIECGFMLENTDTFQGMYSVEMAKENRIKVNFDQVSKLTLNHLSHRLAAINIKLPEAEKEIPSVITFLEMFSVGNVQDLHSEQRWKMNRSYESLRVPIGARSGNLISYFDIHENGHGPHGLVAGTTGSGKSEMLQTWILSLAVNFSPEDVSFLLIDFKGGGMANQFAKLPHLAGVITNLTENQIYRALVSIRSENERRQRMFGEVGVTNIYDYTKLYKNQEVEKPIPHLMIVIDEFAELKKERPEFMNELISVAAIGRSLGVHLVLATQKPAGVVDGSIESNSRFRICLKVQSEQDSMDMLKRKEAAYITQTGRGYLKVGVDELFEQFQSAWSGAQYQIGNDTGTEIAKLYTVNGKTEIVGTYQKMLQRIQVRKEAIRQLVDVVNQIIQKLEISASEYLINEQIRKQANRELYKSLNELEWNLIENHKHNNNFYDLMFVYDLCQKSINDIVQAEDVINTAQRMHRVLPEKAKKTQLSAVVEYLNDRGAHFERSLLWLPELPEELYLQNIMNEANSIDDEWSLDAVVGKYDDPEHQYQGPVVVDFANRGNYGIYGTASSGKSTLLQTLAYSLIHKYTPEQLNLYGVDFSNRMLDCIKSAPHVGGVVGEQDLEQVEKFFFMMREILAERKEALQGGSFSQYIRAGGKNLPAIVVMIDQYGAFREKTESRYDAQILELAKEGNGNGIYLILSAGSKGAGEIPSKLADNLPNALCLQMNDKYQYKEILGNGKLSVMPAEEKGRGLIAMNDSLLEFQAALALSAENDYKRSELIDKNCQKMRNAWDGKVARKIPVIPKEPTFAQFVKDERVQELMKVENLLPMGYNTKSAGIWSLDFSKFYCYLAAGRKRTGKKNFLQLAMRMAAIKGGKIYVFAEGQGIISKLAEEIGATYYDIHDDLEPFCKEIRPELVRRNKKKYGLECNGYSDKEIYKEMSQEENIYLFIEDLSALTEALYKSVPGRASVSGFFETFADKGWYHQIFIFAGMNPDKRQNVLGREFYDYVTRDKAGIFFGGNVQSQQLMEFEYMTFKEQTEKQPIGVGLLASGDGRMKVGKVLIPLARK